MKGAPPDDHSFTQAPDYTRTYFLVREKSVPFGRYHRTLRWDTYDSMTYVRACCGMVLRAPLPVTFSPEPFDKIADPCPGCLPWTI